MDLVGGIGEYEHIWRMAYVRGPQGIVVSMGAVPVLATLPPRTGVQVRQGRSSSSGRIAEAVDA